MDSRKNNSPVTVSDLRNEVIGIDSSVPLLDGTQKSYVFLDNGASTPAFHRVMQCIERFLPWYSGVHRGTGFKSLIATEAYDRAHGVVADFVGADTSLNQVIFTKNTTECTNKLAQRFQFMPGDVVITTGMEHHSNDLPWRKHATVVHVPVRELGYLDLKALRDTLTEHKGKVRLVAVTGASNITGICEPIHEIAEWVHAAGALLFVDAAQLIAHRPIDMLPNNDRRHIDFLAFSAHKIYAPFGTGVLIGPTAFFEGGVPDAVGGGVAAIVTLDSVEWNQPPHKDEAGSPNVIGAIALAEALTVMKEVGMANIAAHENELLAYAYRRLKAIPGLVFYGPTEDLTHRVGVVTFNVEGFHPGLVGAILGTEGGIGVRNGYFCAQPYVKKLLNVSQEEGKDSGCGVVESDAASFAGMVRASFGCYTNATDIDELADMLGRVSRREYRGRYIQDPKSGTFEADGFAPDFSRYFSFGGTVGRAPVRDVSEAS